MNAMIIQNNIIQLRRVILRIVSHLLPKMCLVLL